MFNLGPRTNVPGDLPSGRRPRSGLIFVPRRDVDTCLNQNNNMLFLFLLRERRGDRVTYGHVSVRIVLYYYICISIQRRICIITYNSGSHVIRRGGGLHYYNSPTGTSFFLISLTFTNFSYVYVRVHVRFIRCRVAVASTEARPDCWAENVQRYQRNQTNEGGKSQDGRDERKTKDQRNCQTTIARQHYRSGIWKESDYNFV